MATKRFILRDRRTLRSSNHRSASAPVVIQQTDGEKDAIYRLRLDADWSCEKRLTPQDGSWVVAELRIFATSTGGIVPRGGITARHLRRVRFNDDYSRGLKDLDASCARIVALRRRRLTLTLRLRRTLRETGNYLSVQQERWLRDLRLAEIAQRYAGFRNTGSRRPNVEIARALGLTPATVRDAIHQARLRGLMTTDAQARRGAAKGELTDKARSLLSNADQVRSGQSIRELANQYGLEYSVGSVSEMRDVKGDRNPKKSKN